MAKDLICEMMVDEKITIIQAEVYKPITSAPKDKGDIREGTRKMLQK